GLIPALQETFPAAEHRFCLKHIYDDLKLQWMGEQYKDLLWRCATATTVQRFGKNMEEIKKFDPEMYKWLKDNWEEIVIVQGIIGMSTGPLTPNATKIFNVIKRDAAQYKVIWNGGELYDTTGENNTKTSYGDVQQLQQFRGLERIWKKPPVGRPRKKRRKGAAEIYDNLVKKGKLSRAGKTVTCLKCGQQGHNKRSCKGQRQKGSASGSHALPQAPSQTTTHASAQAPQSSTQPSQALQSSTQPSQASNRFTKSTANRLSPLKKKFVGPRPAAQKNGFPNQLAATKKKDVQKAKVSRRKSEVQWIGNVLGCSLFVF
ncbi:mutator type transposase, partial [Tanacetum coccineum]